jgi:hypothetical protein
MTIPTREQVIEKLRLSLDIRAGENVPIDIGELVDLARADLEAKVQEQAGEIERLTIAIRIKTEEHNCCAEDLLSVTRQRDEAVQDAEQFEKMPFILRIVTEKDGEIVRAA